MSRLHRLSILPLIVFVSFLIWGAPAAPGGPVASISPTSLVFPSQQIGTSGYQLVYITNIGTSPLHVSGVAIDNSLFTPYWNSCQLGTAGVTPGSYCYVSIAFTPTAIGVVTATMTISDDASDSPQTVPISAIGAIPGPIASISPTSIHFAAQPLGFTPSEDYVIVQNSGYLPLHISSVSIDNPVFKLDIYSECNIGSAGGINPSFVCQVDIGFAPTVSGRYAATLTIVDDAPDSPQIIPVTGTATGIEIQPNRLKFHLVQPGQVTTPKTATVTNWGSVPLTISSIAVTGTYAAEYQIQSNTCPQILIPAATCAVGVAFAPTILGKADAALTIADNDAASPQQAALLGDGTDLLLAPAAVNFGNIGVAGNSPPVPIRITNTGTADVTIASIAVNNFYKQTPFYISKNDCSSVLAAGASCVVLVNFDPLVDGLLVGQLVVTDSDGGSPQVAQLYGMGVS